MSFDTPDIRQAIIDAIVDADVIDHQYEGNSRLDIDLAADKIMVIIAEETAKAQINLLNGLLSINFKSVADSRDWIAGQRDMLEAAQPPAGGHEHKWADMLLLSNPPQKVCEICGVTEFVS